MKQRNDIFIGDTVEFSYRNNPTIQLTGHIVKILNNTIIVDISKIATKYNIVELRQVVKHGNYHKVA
ncbi:DUF2187 family protein [Bacillus cereus]|nr:DUF2187 family protein [Bacillus cereus]